MKKLILFLLVTLLPTFAFAGEWPVEYSQKTPVSTSDKVYIQDAATGIIKWATVADIQDAASGGGGGSTSPFVYWGASTETSLTDSEINALDSERSSTRVNDVDITATAEYIYYIYPASYGAATFVINNFDFNDFTVTIVNHEDSDAETRSYRIYRSNNVLTGSYNLEVN